MKVWIVEVKVGKFWRAKGGSYTTRPTDATISLKRNEERHPDCQFRIACYERKD